MNDLMDLSFLSEDINYPVSLLPVKERKREASPLYTSPTGNVIRVYATGEVRLGAQLIEENLLDYTPKGSSSKNNGVDFVYSKKWAMFQELFTTKRDAAIIFFAFVPREEGLIDLFSRCKYNEETNEPIGNVADGAKSDSLLALLTDMGVFASDAYSELKKNELYVDFSISNKAVFPHSKYYVIEKLYNRGENAGKPQIITRSNVIYYAGIMEISPAMQVELQKQTKEELLMQEPVLNSPPVEEDENGTSELKQELELDPEGIEDADDDDFDPNYDENGDYIDEFSSGIEEDEDDELEEDEDADLDLD